MSGIGGLGWPNPEDEPRYRPRMIRVTAWVEIMGKRAEVTFDVESPWTCPGCCPVLQQDADRAVAEWVFKSQLKSGVEVKPGT